MLNALLAVLALLGVAGFITCFLVMEKTRDAREAVLCLVGAAASLALLAGTAYWYDHPLLMIG